MLILDKEVERVVSSSRNRFIGRRMFDEDAIEQIDIIYSTRRNLYIIRGRVGYTNMQNCYVEVNDQNQIMFYECDCFFCDGYSACAHLAALLYKVQELSPDVFPYNYTSNKEEKRLAYLKEIELIRKRREEEERRIYLQQKQQQSKDLITEYRSMMDQLFQAPNALKQSIYCQLEQGYSMQYLRFKIGTKSKYLIKNLKFFLHAIKKHEVISYGKKLSFIHTMDNFDEYGKKQIEFLNQAAIIPTTAIDPKEADKMILLSDESIDLIFDTYSRIPLQYRSFQLSTVEFKPEITIKKEESYYVLSVDNLPPYYYLGDNSLYSIDYQDITKYTFDHEGKVVSFLRGVDDMLVISNDDFPSFYRYLLQSIEPYVIINGQFDDCQQATEINRKLYGDLDDQGNIFLELELTYEDGTIHKGFDVDVDLQSPILEHMIQYIRQFIDEKTSDDKIYHLDQNQESTYHFISTGLPFLANYCEIFVSEVLQKIGEKHKLSMSVGVSIKNNLLEIDISSIDIPKDELVHVLDAYKRKRKFHKLKDGKIVFLESDELQQLDEMMDKYYLTTKDLENGTTTLPMYRAFLLDQDVEDTEYLQMQRSQQFEDTITKLKACKQSELHVPKEYDDILRQYQKEGFSWLQTMKEYGFGGILADDMGLGKTIQVLALLQANRGQTSIVITPASLLLNWADEIHKFHDTLTYGVVHGPKSQRKEVIDAYQQYDVLITSYDYIRRDIELYKNCTFNYIVLDEAQYIKNQKTKNAQSVKQLQSAHKLALTGTPIENTLAELWSIFDFLMKGYLYSYHYFQQQFEIPIVKENNEEVQKQLKQMITPFVLRRTKKEVLKELPDKIENVITLEFSETEKKLYFANLASVNADLQQQLEMDKINKIQILAMLTRLRQICCEPRIVYEDIHVPSSKMEGCMNIIETMHASKKKTLLFSSFTSVLDLVAQELTTKGISYYMLTGKVDKEERRKLVQAFQEDDTAVFLISLKAGGTGLNLTAAEAVIHFDPWWNISAQNQATDRAHRIGQKNTVQVFKLIMKDSIEQKILQLQEQKKDLADTFVEGNSGSITSMDTSQIIDLFRI